MSKKNYRERLPRDVWRVASVAGGASYVDCAAMVSTGIAVVLFQQQLGLGPAEIGAITGLLALAFAIGALVGGRLGDAFGRVRVFTVTILCVMIGAALMMTAVAPWMLFVGVVVMGLGVGADLPVSLAMIGEQVKGPERGRLIAFSNVLWVVAGIVVIILVVALADLGPLCARILFGHVVVVSLVLLVFRARLPESREWVEAKTASIAIHSEGAPTPVGQSLRSLITGPYAPAFVATAVFYSLVNLAVNTGGTFTTYLYVNLAGQTAQFASLVSFGTVGLSLVFALLFMRTVARPSRMTWFAIGAVLYVLGPLAPTLMGVNVPSLIVFSLLIGVGSAFAGEPMYKVWTQELFPTLLRGTAQGTTIAVARFVSAGVTAVTPLLLAVNPTIVFGSLTAVAVVTGCMGLFWLDRLPKVADESSVEQIALAPTETEPTAVDTREGTSIA